ncbi:alpha/beta fold hydrolase [Micromonospora sp. NPDC051006]|uniref:alpha/beta fold hydrolase n=1 Tax=Micromonospora sp. NPDC051006 TaxID=3364283 RepID=UPI00379951F9
MSTDRISEFTSDRARRKFLAAYTRTFDRLWPADHTALDLPTAFGTARVYRTGRPDGTPVVLLPGAGGSSLMWHRYVTRLGAERPVLAVDPCGEPGGSTQDQPINGGADLSQWLGEVLNGLDVDRAHLVGCSYGGWTALQHAINAPDQVASVTLLDPAGFGKVTGRFLAWVIVGGLAGLAPRPLRRRAARWLHNTTLLDDDLMRLALVTAGFRRRLPVPPTLTDEELRAVAAPTLVLLGERSQMYDSALVAARIRSLASAARVEIVPGAGHDLPMYHPELIIDWTTEFLARAETPA